MSTTNTFELAGLPFWRRRRFQRNCLISCVLLGIVFFSSLPLYFSAKAASSKMVRRNSVHQVLVGLDSWDHARGILPDATRINKSGVACCSWRFSLLVFLEGIGQPEPNYDVPWTDSQNERFTTWKTTWFCFSGDRGEPNSTRANLAVVIGTGTPFQEQGSMSMADVAPDTILFIEAKHVSPHWMAPGDLRLDEINQDISHGMDGHGVIVGFADGKVAYLDKSVSIALLKSFFIAKPEVPRYRDELLARYAK